MSELKVDAIVLDNSLSGIVSNLTAVLEMFKIFREPFITWDSCSFSMASDFRLLIISRLTNIK